MPAEEVKVTDPPWQNVVDPIAETVAVGELTLIVELAVEEKPFPSVTVNV